jgi:hypothetical protein
MQGFFGTKKKYFTKGSSMENGLGDADLNE